MKNILFVLVFIMVFASCAEKRAEILESSPKQNVQIRITGIKHNFFEPYNISINIKGYGSDETVTTEVHSGDLNVENVQFEWLSENECFFTFIQQDKTVRRMHLQINEKQLQLKESGSNSADHLSM